MSPAKPTKHERELVKLAQDAYRRCNSAQFASWLRGFGKSGPNSELLRWKFNKMLREKLRD